MEGRRRDRTMLRRMKTIGEWLTRARECVGVANQSRPAELESCGYLQLRKESEQ